MSSLYQLAGLRLVNILVRLATVLAQVQSGSPGEQAGGEYALLPLPTLKDGGLYRLLALALQHYQIASCKQRYLLCMNAQASINADRNH